MRPDADASHQANRTILSPWQGYVKGIHDDSQPAPNGAERPFPDAELYRSNNLGRSLKGAPASTTCRAMARLSTKSRGARSRTQSLQKTLAPSRQALTHPMQTTKTLEHNLLCGDRGRSSQARRDRDGDRHFRRPGTSETSAPKG